MTAMPNLSRLNNRDLIELALSSAQSSLLKLKHCYYDEFTLDFEQILVEKFTWFDSNYRFWQIKCNSDGSDFSHGEILSVGIRVYQVKWPFFFKRTILPNDEIFSVLYDFVNQLSRLSILQPHSQKNIYPQPGNNKYNKL